MKTVELYVRGEEELKAPSDGNFAIFAEHPCQTKYNIIKSLPQNDKKALELLKLFSKENRLSLKVYDISTLRGKLKAAIKGVRITPTIIIDNHKINGFPDIEMLQKTLRK